MYIRSFPRSTEATISAEIHVKFNTTSPDITFFSVSELKKKRWREICKEVSNDRPGLTLFLFFEKLSDSVLEQTFNFHGMEIRFGGAGAKAGLGSVSKSVG